MATALTSIQHQHQHSQQLQFSAPGIPVSSSPVSSASPAPSPASDNFCKECGLAFESQTSLEVHLSYHRSNLLSRWAAQSVPNSNSAATPNSNSVNSNMESKFHPKPEIHPPPSSAPSTPSYYDPPHHAPYSLHSEYQNNVNDGPPHFQRHHYPPPEAPPHVYDHHRREPPMPKDRSAAPPEEILDLDSNKVHIYNLPHHQQLQYIQSNNFYRPYLMTQSPTNPGSHPPPQQNLPPPPPFPHETHPPHMYRPNSPQTRSPAGNMIMNNPYEFSHGHGQYPPAGGPPDHQAPPNAFHHSGPHQGGQGHTFRGNFPPKQPFSEESRSPEPMMTSPSLHMPTERVTTPKGNKKSKAAAGQTNGGGSNEDSNSPAPPRTKGWKGGECKRPKTYNCTACNKWFTSSGHLKRHYGTTLHKNSLRQRGENPDDEPPAPSNGKKSKGPQQQMQLPKRTSGEDCNGSGGESNNDNGVESSASSRAKSDDLPRNSNHSPPPNTNGNGQRLPEFSHTHGHHAMMSPVPPNGGPNPPTYLHVYHNGLQGPPPQGPYAMSPHMMSPHGQFHPSLGYDTPGGLMPSSNVYAVSVPTSMYNGGYPPTLMGSDLPGSSLPPFGTVLSPYDQQFSHAGLTMTSNGPVYLHHGSVGPPPGSPPFDNESGVHSNSTSDGTELKNGESPEAARSASAASGLEISDDAELLSVSSASTGFSSGTDESDLSSGVTSTSPSDTNVIKCPNCSKTFNRPCYLTQHQKSSHSGGKPYKCPTCGKRFLEAPALSDHVAKHGDNKPYKCELCPKQFNHKTDLRRHLCLHSGQKPYVCSICGKGFIRKDHMNKHCETHRKVKGQGNQNQILTQGQ